VHNAIERTVAFTRASYEGLSDYAQQLAAGGRAWAQSGMERVGQVRDAASRLRQNTVERAGTAKENAGNRAGALSARAAELVKQAREGVNAGRQMAVNFGNQAMDVGRQAVELGRQTVETGRQMATDGIAAGRQMATDGIAAGQKAVASGVTAAREAPGKVGRWFNNQISNAAAKASAAFAGIAARRQDPALQGPDLKLPDNLRVVQHLAEISSAQTPEQLNTAAGNLATFINERRQELVGAQAGVSDAQTMAHALQGVAPASEIPGKHAPQATGPAQGQQHGEAAKVNMQKKETGPASER
jgi:hypothetical protein